MSEGALADAIDQLRHYLATPAGRRMQRAVGLAFIVGSPLIFRLPGLRRHWAMRALELAGGAVLLVKLGELIRDWEPGVEPSEWSTP
jgi:hypothetical protein